MKKFLVIGLTGALAGCGLIGAQPVGCTAESAAEPVIGIVREQLEKRLTSELKDSDGGRLVSVANIRAAIAQLTIKLDDLRTSKEDPDSTKRFCTGSLVVRLPSEILSDADKGRAALNLGTVSDLAEERDVEREADRFAHGIEFEVQPTDDGSKVFAETASDNPMFAFVAEVLTAELLRSRVENAQRQQEQDSARKQAEESAALTEQRDANLSSVRTDNQLATQTIGAVWAGLDDLTRKQLLPVQRAWVRKKAADCRVEAAQSSIEPTEIEVARVQCDTRLTRERVQWLQQYHSSESMNQIPDASQSTDGSNDQMM